MEGKIWLIVSDDHIPSWQGRTNIAAQTTTTKAYGRGSAPSRGHETEEARPACLELLTSVSHTPSPKGPTAF